MEISITPELENELNMKVESGLYASVGEVVRESLRLLTERDTLRTELRKGFEQLQRGEGVEIHEELQFLALARGL